MKATAERKRLIADLVMAKRFTARSQIIIPVLKTVLLEPADGGLRIKAADLDVYFSAVVEGSEAAEGIAEYDGAAVDPVELLSVLRASKAQAATIETGEDGARITLDDVSVTVESIAASDFPRWPVVTNQEPGISLSFDRFRAVYGSVQPAISTEESRFQLQGSRLEVKDGQATVVATDGHRLHLAETEVYAEHGVGFETTIPRKATHNLLQVPKTRGRDWSMVMSMADCGPDLYVILKAGPYQVMARELEGSFPDYERVIGAGPYHYTLESEPLLDTCKLAQRGDGKALKITRNGSIQLEGEGFARDLVPSEGTPEDWYFGVNPKYLADAIVACGSDSVRIQGKDENSQIQVLPPTSQFGRQVNIVMPMRL